MFKWDTVSIRLVGVEKEKERTCGLAVQLPRCRLREQAREGVGANREREAVPHKAAGVEGG